LYKILELVSLLPECDIVRIHRLLLVSGIVLDYIVGSLNSNTFYKFVCFNAELAAMVYGTHDDINTAMRNYC